jgi:hypothetical protein
VRLERDGTRITLVSDLGVDSLLDLARSLRRIGGNPPSRNGV